MREFDFPLSEYFSTGLISEPSLNKPGLLQAKNAKVGRAHLEGVPFSNSFIDAAIQWPFPQLMVGRASKVVANATAIYEVGSENNLVKKMSTYTQELWDMVDYGSYAILTADAMVKRNPETGDYESAVSSTFPHMRTICDFKGQLVGGNVPNWMNLGEMGIVWSQIGVADFTVNRKNTAGFRLFPYGGAVRRVMRLGDQVIVYGENGIIALVPSGHVFGMKEICEFGIKSKGAVGGNIHEHVFVAGNGDIYRLSEKGLERLGFSHLMQNAINGQVNVTYNSIKNEYYICAGAQSFVLTERGLGHRDQLITSGGPMSGTFALLCNELSEKPDFLVVSNTFDIRFPGLKTISAVNIGHSANVPLEVSFYWRNSRSEGFRQTNWFRLSPEGFTTVPISGAEFRLAIRAMGFDYVNISSVNVRWKNTDNRAIRGYIDSNR